MKEIFTSHPARLMCKAALRETRRTEWNKWMKFNAGIILTDEEVRQLTEADCEIYPVKWVETNKNAFLPRENDYVSVPATYKSQLAGCKIFVTTEGRRTDSPAGDVDSHNIVCSWSAQATSPFIHAILRTDTFKGKKLIESCCTAFQLTVSQKKELRSERF